jgi:hypothetical protein
MDHPPLGHPTCTTAMINMSIRATSYTVGMTRPYGDDHNAALAELEQLATFLLH